MRPLLVLSLLILSSLYAQKNVRIGFLDLDRVLNVHKGYSEANQELESKIGAWRKEVETRQKELDNQKNSLELERPLITDEIYEERSEDIAFEQEKLNQYMQQRFGTEGDWIKQKVSLAQPAQDEILNAIKEVADDRNLDYVFDSSADIIVLHSEKKYDISDLVIRYIEIEDKKKAQEFLNETKKDERRQRDNPELEARQKALEERKAERLKMLEERKAELKRKKNAKKENGASTAKNTSSDVTDEEEKAARQSKLEQKKKEREAELERRKKEQAEALEKRKQERLQELEQRKKELEKKRAEAQKK